jgi:CubicO group peptidase (beta-lactamase class C family)
VASVSKPVAAMGALLLVEQRRLGLDRPLTVWRFPPSDHDPRAVTLRRLLSHTAGVSVHGYPGHEPARPLPSTAASLAGDSAGAGAVGLEDDPGAGYSYSGGGYTIAQLAVERAAGEPFAAWMLRAVLRPLDQEALQRPGDVPAVLKRPHPLAVEAARPPQQGAEPAPVEPGPSARRAARRSPPRRRRSCANARECPRRARS